MKTKQSLSEFVGATEAPCKKEILSASFTLWKGERPGASNLKRPELVPRKQK